MYDKSKKPFRTGIQTEDWVVQLILESRKEHPKWGAQKLQSILEGREIPVPSARTVHSMLKSKGMIEEEASLAVKPFKRFEREHNNELWQADFKGDFQMIDSEEMLPANNLG